MEFQVFYDTQADVVTIKSINIILMRHFPCSKFHVNLRKP